MRALIAMVALASGCDQLFQVDPIAIHDGGTLDTHTDGALDAGIDTNPVFEAGGSTAYPGDGTFYNSVAVTLGGQIDRNSLVVVAVCDIPDTTLITVSDPVGSTYTHAATADSAVASPLLAATLYYATVPMPAAALEVDVTFGGTGVESPDVRVAAYTNIAEFAPFETASATSAMDVTTLAIAVQVTAVPALLVAATCVGAQSTGIDGFQIRSLTQPNGDLLADSLSDTVSDEIATAHQDSASGMIVQLAAFQGSGPR